MSKDTKQMIISLAKESEDQRKEKDLSSEETLSHFVGHLKENNISLQNWFSVDNDIRKHYENENWFWIIRRLRNTINNYI